MMTAVQPYLDLILQERSWSWAVVCLLYIFAALFVRGWFVGPLSAQMKMLERKHGGQLRKNYLKRSFLGWVFFFLPLAAIALYWQKAMLPFSISDSWFIAVSLASFVFSLLLHLQAFSVASLMTIEALESEKKSDV